MKRVNLVLASLLAVALLALGVLAMAFRCKTDALRAADNSHLVESYIKQDPRFAKIEVWPKRNVTVIKGRILFEETPGLSVWGSIPSTADLADLKKVAGVHARYTLYWNVQIEEDERTGSERPPAGDRLKAPPEE